MSIELQINLPDRRVPVQKADKVVLPIFNGNLTVIDGRAPTMQLLDAGVISLLDENNLSTHKWFINGGVADIAEDKCHIAAEEAIDLSLIKLDDIREKSKNNSFYKKLELYLEAFGEK